MRKVRIMSFDDIENGYFEDEFDQYEEVYQNALTTVKIIEENRRLKRENARLNQKLREYQDNLDKQYKYAQNQVGNILSALINQEK